MESSTAYFYNGEDRVYDADSMSNWLKKFFTTGVFIGECNVTANNNMTVTFSGGYANVGGKVKFFEEEILTVENAHATYNRIDNVVVERNDTDRDFHAKVIKGTVSTNPVAPEPERAAGVYQLVVAQIYVAAGAVRITQANLTDTRGITYLCGYVTGTVTEIDFTQITQQFNAFFEEYREEIEQNYEAYEALIRQLEQQGQLDLTEATAQLQQQFETWFEQIKDQLDTDAAGRIQNELNEQENRLALLEKMVIQNDITAPINLNESGSGDPVLLVDESNNAIIADWKYEYQS